MSVEGQAQTSTTPPGTTPQAGGAALILPGRSSWTPETGTDLERIAPDLVSQMRGLTQLDAVEVCRRPSNDLNPLPVAEPVSFLLNFAFARELVRRGTPVSAIAGYSLGEYAALVLAGSIDFTTGVNLVRTRAQVIEDVIHETPLRMVRIEGGDSAKIVAICEEHGDVWPAAYDSPGQMIVGGQPAALDRVAPKFREAGAERIVLVLNNGGLHTPAMEAGRERMASALADVTIAPPRATVVSSTSGQAESDPERWRELLSEQIYRPMRWQDAVAALPSGATLVECGGNRLLELALAMEPGRQGLVVGSFEDLEAAAAQLSA